MAERPDLATVATDRPANRHTEIIGDGSPTSPLPDPGFGVLVTGPGGVNPAEPWTASRVYAKGETVLNPSGALISRNTAGTARSSFDATEQALWTPIQSNADVVASLAVEAAARAAADALKQDAATAATDSELAAAILAVGGRYRGPYASGTDYKAGDLVTSSGKLYSRKTDGTPSGAFTAGQWDEVALSSDGVIAPAKLGRSAHAYDVIVLGANEQGVTAAIAAARQQVAVLLVGSSDRIGGMTAWGMTAQDILTDTTPSVIGGVTREWFSAVARDESVADRAPEIDFARWYELGGNARPSWHQAAISKLMRGLPITWLPNATIDSVAKTGTTITSVTLSGQAYTAAQIIDCTECGDGAQKAGLTTSIGRESSSLYSEAQAGVVAPQNYPGQTAGVDPYVTPGNAGSGLIYGVDATSVESVGTGDGRVQGFGYRIFVTSVAADKGAWPSSSPAGYSASKYEAIGRAFADSPSYWGDATNGLSRLLTFYDVGKTSGTAVQGGTPHSYADLNSIGPYSTNYPNAAECLEYVTASPARRAEIIANAKNWLLGLIYWLRSSGDSRIPANIISGLNQYAPSNKELVPYGGISPEFYVREGARVVGDYVMAAADMTLANGFTDGVALGAYSFDSHPIRRVVSGGLVKPEGALNAAMTVSQTGFPIPIRVLFPKAAECTNLLCPGAPSVSRYAWLSVRAKPTMMILGEAAGIAAALAAKQGIAVQNVDVGRVQKLQDLKRTGGAIVMSADGVYSGGVVQESGTGAAFAAVTTQKRAGALSTPKLAAANTDRKMRFIPYISRTGLYFLFFKYPPTLNPDSAGTTVTRATNTTVTIVHADGTTTRTINQTWTGAGSGNGGDWDFLGLFYLERLRGGLGDASQYVEINANGSNNNVVADGFKWVPAPRDARLLVPA